MKAWVISSNPSTYDAREAFKAHPQVDWTIKNKFVAGDIVYIYEVTPPRGRGGIVYKTEVVQTNIAFEDKLDDEEFWAGEKYPPNLTLAIFCRLKLVSEARGTGLDLGSLKRHDFTAPQGQAYSLDKKPHLLEYIDSRFE